jgi:nicotinate-nucleotide adenylyltransferase
VRLGILGGSFDPPHLGHLIPAIDAAESLGLDAIRFVTAWEQPFKVGRAGATPDQRFEMTKRLVRGIAGFAADRSEIDREGLSYTVDTVSLLAATNPMAELVLLLGADAYALFEQWREPDRIRALASIAVLQRGGDAPPSQVAGAVQVLKTRRVDISSTELRARVADGRTIRGFTPDAVADYVAEHRLYR